MNKLKSRNMKWGKWFFRISFSHYSGEWNNRSPVWSTIRPINTLYNSIEQRRLGFAPFQIVIVVATQAIQVVFLIFGTYIFPLIIHIPSRHI